MTIQAFSSAAALSPTTACSSTSKGSQVSKVEALQDTSQLSELAKFMKELEDLEKSDPAKFKEVTAQISEKLEAAAEAAKSGDSREAGRLNDLASKFKTASETGEMPDLSRPEGMKGGRGPGGPPPMGPPPDEDDESSSSVSSLYQQSPSADPMSVLSDVLKSVLRSEQ